MSRFSAQTVWRGRRARWTIAGILVGVVIATGVLVVSGRAGVTPAATAAAKPSTCSDAYKFLSLRPSQIAAAHSVCLVQSLKFTGEVAGSVGEAYPMNADDAGPTSMCSVPKRWDGFPQAMLAMVVGTKAYRLRIAVPGISEHQAVTMNNLGNVVELAGIAGKSSDWNQATGTLTLNPDGVTGTIDATLLRDAAGAQPVQVTGGWACGTAGPAAAFDATIPCSNFYALNHLPDADIARMKANACNAESLAVAGDINATVDHAVTDLSFPSNSVISNDNLCDQAYGLYWATMKFSVGDESFELLLEVGGYPTVRPGEYRFDGTGLFRNVALYEGSADPSNHGIFAPDGRIEWFDTGGVITLANDLKSGTLDTNVAGPGFTPFSHIHVTGSWRCAA